MIDAFNSSFSFELGVDLPSDRKRVRSFPPDQTLGETLLVRFETEEDRWIGEFWGPNLCGELTGVRPWFTPDHAAILVHGRCYVVNIRRPEQWQILEQPFAVQQLLPLPDRRLALVAGHTNMACYSESGLRWSSGRLVLDDLKIHAVEEDRIGCSGFLPGANEAQFEVNLATGEPLDKRVREFAVRDLENLR